MDLDQGTPMAGPTDVKSFHEGRQEVLDVIELSTFWEEMIETNPKKFRKIKAALLKAEKEEKQNGKKRKV